MPYLSKLTKRLALAWAVMFAVAACAGGDITAADGSGEPINSASEVASIRVSPDSIELGVGRSFRIQAEPRNRSGRILENEQLVWSTSDANIATVDSTGIVQTTGTGSAEIRVRKGNGHGKTKVTVTLEPVASVALTPSQVTLVVGETTTLQASTLSASDSLLTGRPVSWSSSAQSVAVVNSQGTVEARGEGFATISATSEGRTASAGITVVQPATAPTEPTPEPTPEPVNPPAAPDPNVMVYANLPSALTVRTDAIWQGATPQGWGFAQRQGRIEIRPDASSPTGESLGMFYNAGHPDGHEAGVAYWGDPGVRDHQEMFMATTMRYSSNWVYHQNQVKLHLWNMEDAGWFGIFDGCWRDRAGWWTMAIWGSASIAYPNKSGSCWVNNLVPVPPVHTPGEWVKFELYARKSTNGLANGVIRLWINGVLQLDVSNLSYPPNYRWGEFQHAGTWGGGGPAMPHAQSIHFARTLIATR